MEDLNAREIAYFLPLVVAAFWIGLYPKPVMDVLKQPVIKLVQQVNPAFFAQEALEASQRDAARIGMAGMAAPAHAAPEAHEGAGIHVEAPAAHGEAAPSHGGHH
jgi:NADH-quinone oxidoreductase subunit M